MATTLIVLVCAVPALRAEDKTPADQLKEIRAEITKANQDWQKEYQAAKPEDRAKLIESRPKHEKQIAGLLELAQKNTKEADTAFEALFLVLSLDRGGKATSKALMMLAKDFPASEKFTTAAVMSLGNYGNLEAAECLKAIETQNKDKDVQAVAVYAQGMSVRERVQMLNYISSFPMYAKQLEEQMGKDELAKFMKQEPEKLNAEAEKLFAVVADKYKDVEIQRGMRKAKLGPMADGQLFELRNLVVGKTVPDEALELLDGKKIKLSDYRGKVLVLDIWATWCGPCVAMIPHERDMVKKLSAKPFVLMSISADAQKETLEKFLEKTEMPWTHVHVGNKSGGLTEKWNVRYFPTIYVIDAKGVIRHKDIRGEKLESAVEKLIKEAEEASKKSS